MLTGMRSSRVNLPNRYCHLFGRIAHRAFFLDDGERTRLADLIRRRSRRSTDAAVDALGAATAYGYDALGRQTSVTDPNGMTVTTAYDAEGHVISQRGATYPVDYAYDGFGPGSPMVV